MNLYMFQLEDEFNDNWILYYTDATGKLQLKERYEKFQCSVCGKVDELAALKSGLDENINIKSRRDLFTTHDHIICVSASVAARFERWKIKGLKWLPIMSGKYFVLVPQRFLEVNLAGSGIKFYKPCKACGRPKECLLRPPYELFNFPKRTFDVASFDVMSESVRGRRFKIIFGERMKQLLEEAKVKGLSTIDQADHLFKPASAK